jgi:hypothetical protein
MNFPLAPCWFGRLRGSEGRAERERERDGAPQGVVHGGGTATKPVFNKDTHKTMFSFCVIFRKRSVPAFTQPVTEMGTGRFLGAKARPACKTDDLTATNKRIVYIIWEPPRSVKGTALLLHVYSLCVMCPSLFVCSVWFDVVSYFVSYCT